jgi:hypothetical protein
MQVGLVKDALAMGRAVGVLYRSTVVGCGGTLTGVVASQAWVQKVSKGQRQLCKRVHYEKMWGSVCMSQCGYAWAHIHLSR